MKKRGKKINHTVAVVPLGIKRNTYELAARAALLAIKRNAYNDQHMADLAVLAVLSERLSNERYILVHSASVKRSIEKIWQDGMGFVPRFDYVALESSADLLLGFLSKQKNLDIAQACIQSAGMQ